MLCNKRTLTVAAVHAGWKGFAAGVIDKAVVALGAEDLSVCLGACIGQEHFVVGEDVYQALRKQSKQAFVANGREQYKLDMYRLALDVLYKHGVEDITYQERCTYTDKEDFFSCRRDRECGRVASLIWIE